MNRCFRLLALGSAMAMMPVQNAQAQGSEAGAYCVSYIEVTQAAEGRAAALLKELSAASRAGAGNLRFDAVQRRDRTNHFAIVEAWKDRAAQDANLAAAHTRQFREKLQPMLITGYDERPHTGLAVGPVNAGAGARGSAVYVVTHVDVIPPKKDEAIVALQQLAGASRSEASAQRYDVLQQASRPNHFTLAEIWKDQPALEAHEIAAHTVRFRELLHPMSGALFDQRLYKAID
jgi:quinol monooxygenase YgiN